MLKPTSDEKIAETNLQGLGIYCNEDVLKKISFIAALLHWHRATLIIEAVKHALNLIEHFDNNIIPDFVIFTRALQQSNRYNFRLMEDIKYKSKKVPSTCVLSPIILKKTDSIASSIGFSRNLFITSCLIHAINIIRDEQESPIPDFIKIARTSVPRATNSEFEKIPSSSMDNNLNLSSKLSADKDAQHFPLL